jgi:hypothetical protein
MSAEDRFFEFTYQHLPEGEFSVKSKSPLLPILAISGLISLFWISPCSARGGYGIGPVAGINLDSEDFVVGAQAELGKVLQTARLAPGLDFELGDNTITTLNVDFRWYLFHLPETGLFFYGAAGPTLILDAPKRGGTESEIGLSLVAGLKIPMKGANRYHVEARFGVGDIPDVKLMFGILFGI